MYSVKQIFKIVIILLLTTGINWVYAKGPDLKF